MNGNGYRTRLDQRRAPIHEALENFRRMRVVPFDVPGHKRGRGNPELTAFLGEQCVGVDVNSMKPLDNLCHPVSVIREAEELAADAFGAAHAFLMVGGTTSSVQSMVLSACKRGDEIILPATCTAASSTRWCSAARCRSTSTPRWTSGWASRWACGGNRWPRPSPNIPTPWPCWSTTHVLRHLQRPAGHRAHGPRGRMLCLADEAHGTHFYFGGGCRSRPWRRGPIWRPSRCTRAAAA